jgi:hypothetical protein
MRAYVLVDSPYEKAKKLVDKLRGAEHILAADLINGPHSAVFVLEANESQDLAKTVLFEIGKQSYLRNVTVYLAVNESSKGNGGGGPHKKGYLKARGRTGA